MANTPEQRTASVSDETPKADAYTLWYAIWTAAFLLLVCASRDLDRIFGLYILLVPILGLPAIILSATLVVSLGVNLFKRRWRRSISIVMAPIVVGSFFLLLWRMGINTELIRLELWKSTYLAEVEAQADQGGGHRLKAWDWGAAGGVGVPTFSWTLVYDESDQIALGRSLWSAEWLRQADQAAKGNGFYSIIHPESFAADINEYDRHISISIRRIDGHFFVVEQVFQ